MSEETPEREEVEPQEGEVVHPADEAEAEVIHADGTKD